MDTSRFVIVDDTNPLIQYEGSSWFLDDTGSQDTKGNFGPVYNGTLHGTKVDASLSFSFTGTKFGVIGINDIRNNSGVLDPVWECFVDGIKVDSSTPFKFYENNWRLCSHQPLTLDDGPHTLTLNVTVEGSVPFFFDKIEYTPSASVDLDDKTVYIAVQFGDGWGAIGNNANATTQADASLTFDFYGVSASWYGYIPRSMQPSTGIYTIDESPPTAFSLNAHPEGATLYNMEYFRTTDYPKGQHRLTVSYLGGPSGAAPLLLDYFVVRNTTRAGLKDSNTTGTTIATPNSRLRERLDLGAIIGCVLGGLAMLCLAILIFHYIRQRSKRRSAATLKELSHADMYTEDSTNIPLMSSFVGQSFKSSMQPPAPAPQPYMQSKFTRTSRSSSPSSTGYLPQEQYTETQYFPQPHPQYPVASTSLPAETRLSSSSIPLLDAYHVTEFPVEVVHAPQELQAHNPPSLSQQLLSSQLVLMHRDSGLRNLPAPQRDGTTPLVEIPPSYSQ